MTFEEIKAKFLGKAAQPEIYGVEKASIKNYAIAVGDLNPLYLDEEYSRCFQHDVIMCPPGFFGWPVKQPAPTIPKIIHDVEADLRSAGFPNILAGGSEYEFLSPIRGGDILVCSRSIVDMFTRKNSVGRDMALFVVESTFINQNGSIVSKMRQTLIAMAPA